MKKLTESELLRIVEGEESSALGFANSQLSTSRENAMNYYMGEPFGNEVEGRSVVVSRDVMDTIEWIMPSLMRIFASGDQVVRFEPQGPEDMAAAKQATDYVNYIFQRQNDGFAVLHNWFKDALLLKNGFVKVYWENSSKTSREVYNGLSDVEMGMILADQGIEVLEHTEYPGPQGLVHDLVVRKNQKSGRICIENIPPEEILVRRQTRSMRECKFIAQRCRKTYSELREMGFDVPDDLGGDDDQEFNRERIARHRLDDEMVFSPASESLDKSQKTVWITEAYLYVDYDGDGIAELRQVIKAGKHVFSNEEVDRIPFVTVTPILMPHKLIGLSIYDLVQDLQFIKSTVWRQLLDNMYQNNNSRYMALDGMVNLDDLMLSRPGGIVRVKTFDAVKPLQASPMPAGCYQLLEYTDTVRENRVGVTRYNQGVDADSLNKTATGISQIMSASQQRIELIARVFAETGVKDLFWAIMELSQKYNEKPQMMRLSNQWAQVDPRQWSSRFDMSVSVGLGTGNKDKTLATIQGVMQLQGAALQAGVPVVTPVNIYNAAVEYCRAAELKGADLYFSNPEQMPQEQKPDPKLMAEQMRIQAEVQMSREKNQMSIIKAMIQAEVKRTLQQLAHDQQDEMADRQSAREHTKASMDRIHDANMAALSTALQKMAQPNV